jgi:NMD protein affecting ribosome stability and mRNA decay
MKLLREYRLLTSSGIMIIKLDCKLFTEKNARSFYTSYSMKLPSQCPLKLVVVDVLGNCSELNTEGL